MGLFEEAKKFTTELINLFKKTGYTDEDLRDGLDEAESFISKMKISQDKKDLIIKVIKDKRKDL